MNETIKEVIETLEATANKLRHNHETAKENLTPQQLGQYESLALSVCFTLLKASEFESSINAND